eukprot:CAMPEP_0174993566 /NCGR_PEP_ID=MMETSP0004_2-20121128/23145_1 /TAXON_ID=420556 /ORGANISM="Ochromonas sp., Strain CCMP1393" /LENGTH=506 /DNA_ID=CAMNT_0016247693 /DNA_START=245 /DNA_END=1765 /DNA_ORIENTATION=-
MAVCLGGVGIWCMHFVGMNAVSLYNTKGEKLEIHYNLWLTLLSLVLVLMFGLAGFAISSRDKVFTKSKREIAEMFVADAKHLSLKDIQHISSLHMVFLIGSNSLQHLCIGGFLTGCGVVVMHYVGMASIEFQGHIVWDEGIIAASALIAFGASTAAFWILFRLLSIYPNKELFRLICAFVMAVAVCGMHYTGMMAARFEFDEDAEPPTNDSNVHIPSTNQFLIGVLISTFTCIAALIVVMADLRYSVSKLAYELSRADDLVMNLTIPSGSNCATNVRRYIFKRKTSEFNAGLITGSQRRDDVFGEDDASSKDGDEDGQSVVSYRSAGSHPGGHPGGHPKKKATDRQNFSRAMSPVDSKYRVVPCTADSEMGNDGDKLLEAELSLTSTAGASASTTGTTAATTSTSTAATTSSTTGSTAAAAIKSKDGLAKLRLEEEKDVSEQVKELSRSLSVKEAKALTPAGSSRSNRRVLEEVEDVEVAEHIREISQQRSNTATTSAGTTIEELV